jgi:two-component system, sensor histidine kinase
VIEVWDTGVGIPREQHDEIFREFHQLGNVERDRRKGLGLGLAIARRLTDLIEGDLSVASRVGRGSVFRLHLRRATVSAVPPSPPEIAEEAFPVARIGGQRLKILVLDDDEAIGVGMHMLLDGWGYDCRVTETIADALTVTRTWKPAALICDLRLRGEENGLDAARRLRAQLGGEIPVVIITGDTHPDRLREAAQAAVTVIHKPVKPETLQRALRRALDTGVDRSGFLPAF